MRSERIMEKEKHEGVDLPAELNQIKEQIERERFQHIHKTFESRFIESVTTHASNHQWLALIRCNGEYSNGRCNNMLSSRMETPLLHYNGLYSYDSSEEDDIHYGEYDVPYEEDILPSVKLPFVEKLPQSITWVFADSNKLMAESESVVGKKQIYYLDGEAVELRSDNEKDDEGDEEEHEQEQEVEKENFEFSKDADRFIWKIEQEYSLDDPMVQSALSKFLELDVSDILERYNELKKLKNEGKIGEVSDKITITSFFDIADRHFCRRCLNFSCQMHDEYQPVINTRENKSILFENEDVIEQCSEHCYLKLRRVTESDNEWTPVEKDLYFNGVEIFGKSSCLITKNVLAGLKTCLEVYNYMREQDQCTVLLEHNNETEETDNEVDKEASRRKHRMVRKKAKLRKYARYPLAIKNAAKEQYKSYKQYTPCTCKPSCGDQCICLTSGNCCEKYCGCPRICNNRFEGCNCAKGQCINRQCPCFAACRECDPDLCRSCCLSCGDGSSPSDETSRCKNMKFLLKKHNRILLAKSDVHGWGAFTRDSLKKNEFIGEYTGELISHDEANERGRADDQLGFSYLFTLNDQLVIDARHKGNKFRFLNHSSRPNCYAKLMIARGDHRIGIFADKAIEEGDELFFDYCYGPGQAAWSRSRKPRKSCGSKKIGASKTSRNVGLSMVGLASD